MLDVPISPLAHSRIPSSFFVRLPLQSRPLRVITVGRILSHLECDAARMRINEDPYTQCDGCGKSLFAGNLVVSFCRSIEQMNYTKEYPEGEVTVADCYQLITLCVDCGNQFRVARATAVLKAAVQLPQFTSLTRN